MRRRVRVQDTVIEYELTYKRVKNLNLRLHKDGSIRVSAPRRADPAAVDAFVAGRADWIAAHLEALQKVRAEAVTPAQGEVVVLGRAYSLQAEKGAAAELHLEENLLLLTVPPDTSPDNALAVAWPVFCRDVFARALEDVYPRFADYRIPMPRCQIKDMTSRWGSCTPSRQRISLNAKLIHAPMECLEYVIAHELAHMIECNHSPAFYAVLDRVMPDHRMRRARLRRAGIL